MDRNNHDDETGTDLAVTLYLPLNDKVSVERMQKLTLALAHMMATYFKGATVALVAEPMPPGAATTAIDAAMAEKDHSVRWLLTVDEGQVYGPPAIVQRGESGWDDEATAS